MLLYTYVVRRSQCPIAVLLSFSLIGPLLPLHAQAQADSARPAQGFGSRVKHDGLLSRIIFKTPQGEIRLSLPAEIRAGETISGSIRLMPRGTEAAQQHQNETMLSGYLLTLGSQSVSTGKAFGRWVLPAGSEGRLVLQQQDAPNTERAHAVLSFSPPVTPGSEISKRALPSAGRADRPLALPGQAEADWQTLHVLIGGKEAGFLAASRRVYLVQSPPDVFGKTSLQIRRSDDVLAESVFRNERVRHSFNPWPYIIVAVTVEVIAIVVALATLDLGQGIHFPSGGL